MFGGFNIARLLEAPPFSIVVVVAAISSEFLNCWQFDDDDFSLNTIKYNIQCSSLFTRCSFHFCFLRPLVTYIRIDLVTLVQTPLCIICIVNTVDTVEAS